MGLRRVESKVAKTTGATLGWGIRIVILVGIWSGAGDTLGGHPSGLRAGQETVYDILRQRIWFNEERTKCPNP